MTDRKALTRIAKGVVADMASERISAASQRSIRALEDEPEHVFDLVDLLAKESKKKRANDPLINGFAYLLAHGLEILRYGVDREDTAISTVVGRLRQHLVSAGEAGSMTPAMLLMVMHQFTSAKLEIGDELRDLMQTLMANDGDARAACERGEGADHFARMVAQCGGDPFAIHACLDEAIDAVPKDSREELVMATFADKDPALREATIGFLLNASADVRGKLIELLELAAPHGLVSPAMLRRMIAMRNWLPTADRKGLDTVIKVARASQVRARLVTMGYRMVPV